MKKFLKNRVVFICSSGGHLSEILQLKSIFSLFDSVLITEKDAFSDKQQITGIQKIYFLNGARRDSMFKFIWHNFLNLLKSIILFLKLRPKAIVTTGANTCVYFSIIGHLFGSKLLFIETMAAIEKKSNTGALLYPISYKFFIQWEEMKKCYPDSIYIGTLY